MVAGGPVLSLLGSPDCKENAAAGLWCGINLKGSFAVNNFNVVQLGVSAATVSDQTWVRGFI